MVINKMSNFSNGVLYFISLLVFLIKSSALSEPTDGNFSKVLDNSSVSISLSNYNVSNPEGESVDSLYLLPPYSEIEILVREIPQDVHFVMVQVHSYLVSVTLSLDSVPSQKNSITGTNVGLLKINEKGVSSFYLTYNNSAEEANIMISVQAYSKYAPMPGGCNMEFQVEVSPFLVTTYDDVLTEVTFAPSAPPSSVFSQFPLFPSNECNIKPSPVEHKLYYHYLPERDFTKETYFSALKSMMTRGRILRNGVLAPKKLTPSPVKKIFSTYPGTGRAFAVISYVGNFSAAYVPSFTYGCNDLRSDNTCDVLTTKFSKVLCASILFMGLFTCFFGHFFFRLEMFFFGFLATGIVTYTLVTLFFSSENALTFAVTLGFFGGLAKVLFGFTLCGLPVLSVILATLTLGFLSSSLIFYPITDYVDLFVSDINYWGIFIGILTAFPIIMLCLAEKANIISSAVVGSYVGITSVDHYLGSNLRYIVINTIRRATTDKFRYAITAPPFQLNDLILSIAWLILALVGKEVQRRLMKNRPPFPPPDNLFKRWKRSPNHRSNTPSERTPLVSDGLSGSYVPPNYFPNYSFFVTRTETDVIQNQRLEENP